MIYMSRVSLVKVQNNDISNAIEKAMELIDYDVRRDARNVVIKANMCYYWDYSTGQTTDPKFVGALIDVIRRTASPSARISVVESDASAMRCKHVFKFLSYEKLREEHDFDIVNLSEEESDPVDVSIGNLQFRLFVPRIIKNADLRLNVTKIKYSLDSVKLTCALKNVFGCNPYPNKYKYHQYLNETIVAVNKAMKFDLCLVDGNIVVGSGVRKLGLVMASEDPVAIDTAAAKIAGVNPKSVKYLKIAAKEGLGSMSYDKVGEPIGYFEKRYPRRTATKKLLNQAANVVTLLKLGRRLGIE